MSGEFFALIDESAGSERRLDELARPILEKTAELEKRAALVIQAKHARLDASLDYVKRLDAGVHALEEAEKASNGGPTVQGSATSPQPSAMPPQLSPIVAQVPGTTSAPDQVRERQPSDYNITNGIGR